MADAPRTQLVHDTEADRFDLLVDDAPLAVLRYERRPSGTEEVLDLFEARVFPEARGRGLGGILVRDALRSLDQAGAKVVPSCWFVRSFIDANPEYAHLVADA